MAPGHLVDVACVVFVVGEVQSVGNLCLDNRSMTVHVEFMADVSVRRILSRYFVCCVCISAWKLLFISQCSVLHCNSVI